MILTNIKENSTIAPVVEKLINEGVIDLKEVKDLLGEKYDTLHNGLKEIIESESSLTIPEKKRGVLANLFRLYANHDINRLKNVTNVLSENHQVFPETYNALITSKIREITLQEPSENIIKNTLTGYYYTLLKNLGYIRVLKPQDESNEVLEYLNTDLELNRLKNKFYMLKEKKSKYLKILNLLFKLPGAFNFAMDTGDKVIYNTVKAEIESTKESYLKLETLSDTSTKLCLFNPMHVKSSDIKSTFTIYNEDIVEIGNSMVEEYKKNYIHENNLLEELTRPCDLIFKRLISMIDEQELTIDSLFKANISGTDKLMLDYQETGLSAVYLLNDINNDIIELINEITTQIDIFIDSYTDLVQCIRNY